MIAYLKYNTSMHTFKSAAVYTTCFAYKLRRICGDILILVSILLNSILVYFFGNMVYIKKHILRSIYGPSSKHFQYYFILLKYIVYATVMFISKYSKYKATQIYILDISKNYMCSCSYFCRHAHLKSSRLPLVLSSNQSILQS